MQSEIARIAKANPDVFFLADSRAFIDAFSAVSIKCNNFEAAAITRLSGAEEPFSVSRVKEDLIRLEQKTGLPVFVTCNRHGIMVRSDGDVVLVPAVLQQGPIDICGAGDAATAGIALAMSAGASPKEAARIACLASGVTVRKLNETGTASREEMLALFLEAEQA